MAETIFDAVNHGIGFESVPAKEPTNAPPGSSEKLQVLLQRIESGQSLWHDDDCTEYSGPPRGHASHMGQEL